MKATKKRQMRYAVSYMTHVMRLIVAECKGTGSVVSAN